MNYQEMSDRSIDLAVFQTIFGKDVFTKDADLRRKWERGISYCNSWADAGPIIENNGISLYHHYDGRWDADIEVSAPIGVFGTDEICVKFTTHKNPLRAAMIVFLMMKGGE